MTPTASGNSPLNPYRHWAAEFARYAREGKSFPLGAFPACPKPALAKDAPKVLIFSPHPDDEVIVGGIALRLLREAGWRVMNVAVTQGSKKDRQAARLEELRRCCDCIGFDCIQTAPHGLERINPKTRKDDPTHWQAAVQALAGILETQRPRAILFPHDLDWNSTHVGTHWLVRDALERQAPDFACHTLETEYWGQIPDPNLMVELTPEHVGDLVTALTFHVGEVQRNPYHLSVPAWMMDNVRRGGELVGGQGGATPDFAFATLYRLRRWIRGDFETIDLGGRFLARHQSPAVLFA